MTPTAADPVTGVSNAQYQLTNSDGLRWNDIDATNLALTVRPAVDSFAIIGGNADLWTASAGFNQDLGLSVNGSIAAWKESGGFAGTFSPNAAFVQTVYPMTAGTTYTVKLQWKTNKPAPGATIVAGAGPAAPYSPTRLTVQLVPKSSGTVATAVSTQQYLLTNSAGSTYTDIDPGTLSLTYTPTTSGTALLSGNADLWTVNPGYNQDLGISVNGALAGWKESGGFAGTFSPNAAFAQATYTMTAGVPYSVKLQWKTNKAAAGATIVAGAGTGAPFSPTRLSLHFFPAGTGLIDKASTLQYRLAGSDGTTWVDVDAANLGLSVTPAAGCAAILTANADLFTANAGSNQDLGIDVNGSLVAWKESGGFAGTFSPNAAFVQTIVTLPGARRRPSSCAGRPTVRRQAPPSSRRPARASRIRRPGLPLSWSAADLKPGARTGILMAEILVPRLVGFALIGLGARSHLWHTPSRRTRPRPRRSWPRLAPPPA